MADIIHLPMIPRQHNWYFSELSNEDNAILIDRLRLYANALGRNLHTISRLIPTAASPLRYDCVDRLFLLDMDFVLAWLNDRPKPSLEELHLISVIVDKWEANHHRTIPHWNSNATPEEKELNERILAVVRRLIAKGENANDEDERTKLARP